jgi:hypothetical protein
LRHEALRLGPLSRQEIRLKTVDAAIALMRAMIAGKPASNWT